ncbi:hypothetical protein [Thermocoleostomius sinensis]|uniref:Carbohydrate porin n=1 Tax=Thermocoleostomius sinensis A174 TaxID=2016057 RepID=A0A9E9C7K4_9CYAN|nr:hypothetical protein [Thermocoleostomius sinensis]WAL60454.1 hypothetical protein OXH18_00230 [Thermocoleostomius sinensis A174]
MTSPVYRSCFIPFPSTFLSFLASVSATSLGSWLLLGSAAYGYSQTTIIEDSQAAIDLADTQLDQDSSQINSLTVSLPFAGAADLLHFADAELERGTDLEQEPVQIGSSIAVLSPVNDSLVSSVVIDEFDSTTSDSNVVDLILQQNQDLVEVYDTAIMKEWEILSKELSQEVSQNLSSSSQDPFIEIVDTKEIDSSSSVLLESYRWESIEANEDENRAVNNEETDNFDSTYSSQLFPQFVSRSTPNLITQSESQSQTSAQASDLGEPIVTAQGVYLLQGAESSARARLSASYALTPNVLFGATLDFTTGDALTNSSGDGVDLNELFVTVSPPTVPSLRLTLGMIDLTSYFDRNSFAKDAATHFFNPVFQTNPALAAAGIGSRPGVLVNWDVTDHLSMRGAAFSSDRDLDEFAFDGAAAEVALRLGNLIVRGTYATGRDAGQDSGFNEIFQFQREGDEFGLQPNDREVAYGINAEYFIPAINLGLFARYGWYENQTLDRGGNTYSVGLNALDLFFADDRLGLGYGRALSNDSLRRDRDDEIPDVWELFYDVRLTRNFRVGASLQAREAFSETVAGLRIRADFNLSDLWR